MLEFRTLKASEIECKVSMVRETGVQLLLYKTARTDMQLLDETLGAYNWQCKYEEIKGNMYCTISIYDTDKKEWVHKQDCGVESAFGDKEKGEASDAFKRAGFKVGIGRELYTSPFIWITKDNCNIKESTNAQGKKIYTTNDTFIVDSISYSKERDIISLVIRNCKTNEICYQMKDNRNATVELIEKAKSIGVDLQKVCNFYGAKIPADLKYYQLEGSINAKLKAGGIK
jgi:hypothetical protein